MGRVEGKWGGRECRKIYSTLKTKNFYLKYINAFLKTTREMTEDK